MASIYRETAGSLRFVFGRSLFRTSLDWIGFDRGMLTRQRQFSYEPTAKRLKFFSRYDSDSAHLVERS